MAFSYSGLINYGATTLPSVEGWSSNMNILRDPTRSITTRRIDKVGDTNDITKMIDGGGDRVCEAISTYTRGVNPMVSISYNNNGNNGGQNSSGFKSGGQTQAYSSMAIMRDGEFRPPVLRQEELMPLSRQPRIWTTASTKPGFVDFSKKMRTCGTAQNTKEVKNRTLHAFVRPTAVYKVEKPISEPFEVKYVIQPTIKTSGSSGIRSMDHTTQNVLKPTKEVNRNMVYAYAQSNVRNNQHHVDNITINTDPYTQDTNAHSVYSNVGSNLNVTNIEDIVDFSDIKTQDIINIQYGTALSGTDQSSYIHNDIELSRKLPQHTTRTNTGQNIHKRIQHENKIELERNTPLTNVYVNHGNSSGGNSNISSRDYHLAPKIQPGGYHIPTQVPMRNRMQDVQLSKESEKSKMARSVMEQFQGRYTH